MVYLSLLYQDSVLTGPLAAEGRLPPVLPIVLYNGSRRWGAPVDVAELVVPMPGGLETYRLQGAHGTTLGRTRSTSLQIRLAEIVADEQQSLSCDLGKRVDTVFPVKNKLRSWLDKVFEF